MKYLLLLILLFPTTTSDEPYSFINDCLDIFIRLDSATKKYESIVQTEKDQNLLNKEIKSYVDELVLYSMNRLNNYTKSDDQLIQSVSKDLTEELSNLVRINYGYLNFVTNTKSSKKELKSKGLEMINQLKEESRKFIDISTGICMTAVDPNKKTENQKQYLRLTYEQANSLILKMQDTFTNLDVQDNVESTHFEKSVAIINHFLNLDSEYSKDKNGG